MQEPGQACARETTNGRAHQYVAQVLTKPLAKGGLNFGTVGASTVLGVVLVTFVLFAAREEKRRATAASTPAISV